MIDFDRLVKPGFGVEGQDSMLLLFGTVLKTSLFYVYHLSERIKFLASLPN